MMRKRRGIEDQRPGRSIPTDEEWADPELDRLLDLLIRYGLFDAELIPLLRP
jgi:hypothetical protein